MQDVLSLILGGGRGAPLYPLTKTRSTPAVPFAGNYRLIDIPISNCLNSEIHRVYVITQFLSVSLHRHIANTYQFDAFGQTYVEVLAAQQTNEAADWYQGTADALRQNLRTIEDEQPRDVAVLSADQVYRMDFRPVVAAHRANAADMTICVVPVSEERASSYGVVQADETGRITGISEKPTRIEELRTLRISPAWRKKFGLPDDGRDYLANMGIYLFRRESLIEMLKELPDKADLVREFFPDMLRRRKVQIYLFNGYWQDVGSIRTFFEANLALAGDEPPFDFHSPEGVIYTRGRHLPAVRISQASLEDSLVSDGCVVEPGVQLVRCVLGVRSRIGRNSVLRDCVVMGADRFETDATRADNRRRNRPDLTVGADCVIERAILDKDCRIGNNVRILNKNRVTHADAATHVIRDGIVVIPNGVAIPDNTII